MVDITLEVAREVDAERLSEISKQAFHTDVQWGAKAEEGPIGYDSLEWQKKEIDSATAYLKIVAEGRPVGGLIIYDQGKGRYYLGRVFIAPSHQRKGIGLRAIEMLFQTFPDATTWWLDTPVWNTRTPGFYEKLGFKAVDQRDELLIFEKVIC